MKRVITLCLLVVLVLIFVRATCGKIKPPLKEPVEVMKIKDNVYFHNISITYNQKHYFTINGGNENYCKINEYDKDGEFITSYDVGLDGRAIFFNANDGEFYVKVYGYDIYRLDLEAEEAETKFNYIFDEDNSSPAISPDGKYFYELVDGEVTVFDSETGEELRNFKIMKYYDEHGYSSCIAASGYYLFIWGDEDEILVYDLDGEYVTAFTLPRLGFGFSLSYCNGLLWIAVDADAASEGGVGFWYGYRL